MLIFCTARSSGVRPMIRMQRRVCLLQLQNLLGASRLLRKKRVVYAEAQLSVAAPTVLYLEKLKVKYWVVISRPFLLSLQRIVAFYDERSISTHGAPALGSQSPCAVNAHVVHTGLCHHQRTYQVRRMIWLHFKPASQCDTDLL